MTDTWMSWHLELRWPSGLKMSYTNDTGWQSNNRKTDKDLNQHGCRFVGDQGWVHVNRGGIWAEPASLLTVKLKPGDTLLRHNSGNNDGPGYTTHTADFFRSIRTRQDPVSPVESGQLASTLGNVSDIALRLGRKLKWDPTQDRFLGDDEANQMLSRPSRSPWTI
jgi:hypothetical protein